jgi:dihydrofolate reductase
MRKVILQEFLTLDGLAAGPDGNTDFVPAATQGDESFADDQMKLMDNADTMLLGRVTYQLFADFWPKATEGEEKEFAKKLNSMHKIVVSNTIDSAPWGDWEPGLVIKGHAVKEVPKLKEEPGENMIIWGSISLAQSLINEGLIDDYRLVTCPVVLGSGRSFFGDKVDALNFKLVDARTFDLGVVQLKYLPAPMAANRSAA